MAQQWNKNIVRIKDIFPDEVNNPQLKPALVNFLEVWNKPLPSEEELQTAVAGIAGVLNWDAEKAQETFAKFTLRATDESKTAYLESFLASREALLFGRIVGDVLGIDPVFAALLSPTGGMVGPGKNAIHVKGGVLGHHGAAHDAGGYLCRTHNIVPGYEYIKDKPGDPCEDSALSGQVSGITFWSKVLKLGWLNFLAESDPVAHVTPSLESLAPAPGLLPSSSDTTDGILLNRAEVLFLRSLILREADPADADLIEQGLKSLRERGFVSGNVEEGYTINDQLVLATAVYLEPQLMLEASPGAFEAVGGGEPINYYQWGDYFVEQTSPAPGQIRLAGLNDALHATERLGQVIPLSEGELEALSLSMTEDEFEKAEAGTFDPGDATALESLGGPSPESAADLAESLGSGQLVGTIRVQKFDGRKPTATRDLKFLQGPQGTWLVSRDSQNADQVDVSLATPEAIGEELEG